VSEVIPAAAIDAVVAKGRESRLYISRKYAQGLLEAAAPILIADATAAVEEARVELERRRNDFEQAADKMPNPTDPYGMNQREWLRTTSNPYRSQA
jgi:hypothetical protein